jgi:nuclear transcription factor Y gamma
MDPNYPRPPAPGAQQMAPQPPPFPYDPATNGGHFGASSAVAQSGYIPATAQFNSTFQNVTNGLQGQYRNVLATYWQHVIHEIENEEHDFKIHQLPLARIKVPAPLLPPITLSSLLVLFPYLY